MINTETKQVVSVYVTSVSCDCCKKQYFNIMDRQEFLHIDVIGGYNSAIGDEAHYRCDLCTDCIKRLLGKYLRIDERI